MTQNSDAINKKQSNLTTLIFKYIYQKHYKIKWKDNWQTEWKYLQDLLCHSKLEKCKLKPHKGIISHLWDWQKIKSMKLHPVGKTVRSTPMHC